MFGTEEEVAAMYARWCRSWYGAKAKSVIRAKIRALKARGRSQRRRGLGASSPSADPAKVGPGQTHP